MHADRRITAEGAAAVARVKEIACIRIKNNADHRFTPVQDGNRDAPGIHAVHKTRCAVDRVYHPHEVGVDGLMPILLAEKTVGRESLMNVPTDKALDITVGGADLILHPFELDNQLVASAK